MKVSHTTPRWLWLNINQTLNSQKTPHNLPSRASYGVSLVSILEETDGVITSPHCVSSCILFFDMHYAQDITLHIAEISIFLLR